MGFNVCGASALCRAYTGWLCVVGKLRGQTGGSVAADFKYPRDRPKMPRFSESEGTCRLRRQYNNGFGIRFSAYIEGRGKEAWLFPFLLSLTFSSL
jgi:hypothetical protein